MPGLDLGQLHSGHLDLQELSQRLLGHAQLGHATGPSPFYAPKACR